MAVSPIWRAFHRARRSLVSLAGRAMLCWKVSGFSPLCLETSAPIQTDLACFRKIRHFVFLNRSTLYGFRNKWMYSRALGLHQFRCNSFYSAPDASPYCRFTIHPWVRSVLFVKHSNQIHHLCQCGTIWSVLSMVMWVVMLLYITIQASS